MDERMGITKCGNTEFRWGERTYVMGIVNVSPESFSGDGIADVSAAVEQAQRMVAEGADILDVGGESTRPGAAPITVEEELRRVIPVIEKLAPSVTVPISVDTYKSEVAEQALRAGAAMLNDQWGLKKDRKLADLVVEWGVPIVLMSNQRDKGGYDAGAQRDNSRYDDVMAEVISSQRESMDRALQSIRFAREMGWPFIAT